ncbi:MAG: anthranilate phosphoribosyltransferase [Bacteroidota bacterium]|nr:anthranilate phosphoribosyltransferase [Bacteroidota bacterium]
MKKVLESLFNHNILSEDEANNVLVRIAAGEGTEAQLSAFMTVFLMRTVTLGELSGFRSALLGLCKTISLDSENAIDLCGTGGDGKNTFNISTLSSFVVAGAGGKVIKHGNYGVSSVSGSSNVMEYFGYKFSDDQLKIEKTFNECGVCFLHAPLFHPALKRVGSIRRDLGVKTFFNMLGPLVNPARPKYRVTGVFNLELARAYEYLIQQTNEKYVILHSLDGYDEFSLTSDAKIFTNKGEQILSPTRYGFEKLQPSDILGGATVEAAANVFKEILNNRGTKAQQDVVVANAALALQCLEMYQTLEEAIDASRESLTSGKALNVFKRTLELN